VFLQQAIVERRTLARRGIASVLHLGVGNSTGGKMARTAGSIRAGIR
jgi:hypothetical protein